jgi:cell division protein FtsW
MTKPGVFLFVTSILLSLLGIFLLYESSTYPALLTLSDKYYFVKNQAMWFLIGIVACIVVSRINYKIYYRMALPLLLGTLLLLVLVFIPGIGLTLKGASRWLNLGFTVIQPSEILKISLTVYLAAWLSTREKGRFLAFLLLLALSVLLVVMEPDMGTGLIIAATATAVYFLSGAPVKDMVLILVILALAVLMLVKLEPYRVARLAAYQNFNPKDLSTTSYHVKQILISLGSGGLTGVGLGKSVQKYGYLPESTTDSIFAIFAEEAGYIGSLLLLLTFAALFLSGFMIAFTSPDVFGKLLACGIITFLAIQAYLNLASQAVIIPLTGVPLPFISYGGSSLIINLISIGILLNIARRPQYKKEKKEVRKYRIKLRR